MKNFLYYIGIFAAFITAAAVSVNAANCGERYNNTKNISAVREIAKEEEVCDAAVLSRGGCVMTGVLLENRENIDEICKTVSQIIKKYYPNMKKIIVAVDDDKALDILELSYYIDAEMDSKILVKRFNALKKELP